MLTRYFALAMGIVYTLVGIMGLIGLGLVPDPPPADLSVTSQYGLLLGLFPVNLLHNIVHLAIGVLGLIGYRSFGAARTYARGLAVFYALLAIMGLIEPLNTMFGLVPLFSNDIWLHIVSAIPAAYFGFIHHERTQGTTVRP